MPEEDKTALDPGTQDPASDPAQPTTTQPPAGSDPAGNPASDPELEDWKKRFTNLSRTHQQAMDENKTLKAQLVDQGSQIEQLKAEIEGLKQQVETVTGSASSVAEQLTANQNRVNYLETVMREYPGLSHLALTRTDPEGNEIAPVVNDKLTGAALKSHLHLLQETIDLARKQAVAEHVEGAALPAATPRDTQPDLSEQQILIKLGEPGLEPELRKKYMEMLEHMG